MDLGASLRAGSAGMVAALAAGLASGSAALAQTDEIQVYDGSIADPGAWNLTLHSNFTPKGLAAPAFPGGLSSDRTLNGVPEIAYGVAPFLEAGLYLPLYSLDRRGRAYLDGFKLRALFAVPDAAKRSFFWGVNVELSVNARQWDPSRVGGEVRPIVGWRGGPFTLVFNPIFDTRFNGVSRLVFAPETRLSWAVSSRWTLAAEEYDEFGSVSAPLASGRQVHQIFGVLDYTGKPVAVEIGAGFGLTPATDRFTLKLIVSKDF